MFAMTPRTLWKGMFLALAIVAVLAVFLALSIPPQATGQSGTPARPTGVSVSVEDGSLEVSIDWNDVSGATSYVVRWREHGAGNDLNTGITVDDSNATITVEDAGEWVVRVQACNGNGCGRGAAKRFTVTAAEPEPTPTPTSTPTPEPEFQTTFVLMEHGGERTVSSTTRNGVTEWEPFTMTASSTLYLPWFEAADDDLPRNPGGNGNYYVRIERASGSDSEITVTPSCLEFTSGGGASTRRDIDIDVSHYYSFQGKSAEFMVYETTGETGCTNVQETANPVFIPGKIVINSLAQPPLTMPDRIELAEGETYNSTGLPALAPDPVNRVKVKVIQFYDGDVTVSPTEFWIAPGNYDFYQWPNVRITALPDADTVNDSKLLLFVLSNQEREITFDSLEVIVHDGISGLEFQDVASTSNFTGSVAVPEGQQMTFRVRLTTPSTDGNTVEIHTSLSGGSSLQLTAPSLVYGQDDWNQWRTITLDAATDANSVDEQYTVTLWTTSAGDAAYNRGSSTYFGGSGAHLRDWTINVTVTEGPPPEPGIAVQATGLVAYVKPSANLKNADRQLEISNGESVDLRVRLTQAPNSNLTLSSFLGKLHTSETRLENVTITPDRLTFTPSNWDTWQTMSVSATAGAGERGMIYLDARVASGDPDYAPSQDVSFDIALFRNEAAKPEAVSPPDTAFVLKEHFGDRTISSTIRNGVTEWEPFTISSGGSIASPWLEASDDDLPRNTGGNGNYYVRIERTSGSDPELRVTPSCLEFTSGGGASSQRDISIGANHYSSSQGKSAEFMVYETTGETDCTNVRETTNPVFIPGKIVVNSRANPPLTLPERIDLVEGETYNTSGLSTVATNPLNRVRVNVAILGNGVTVSPTSFWIPPGSYDIAQWPSMQITAQRDADNSDEVVGVAFDLVYQSQIHASGGFGIHVQDRNPGIEFQDIGAANFTGSAAVPEGQQTTFRVRPAAPPTDGNSLEIHTSVSGGSGLQLTAPSLVYDQDNWDQWRTVTLDAATDANSVDEQYAITLWTTSAGDAAYNRGSSAYFGGSGANLTDWTINVTVSEDTPVPQPYPGIEVDATELEAYVKRAANHKDGDGQLEMSNGDSVTLRVRLTQAPDAQLRLTANVAKIRAHIVGNAPGKP